MRHLKKFESYETNLKDEILEYFIDMDKNHGGSWDVDVISKFVKEEKRGNPNFYRVSIESRSDFEFDKIFLKEIRDRVGRVLSIGDFSLHNGGRHGVGDPNKGRGNFGFFFLDCELLKNPVVEIDNDTISSINSIKEKIGSEYYRQRNSILSKNSISKTTIKFGSLVLWFKENNYVE